MSLWVNQRKMVAGTGASIIRNSQVSLAVASIAQLNRYITMPIEKRVWSTMNHLK